MKNKIKRKIQSSKPFRNKSIIQQLRHLFQTCPEKILTDKQVVSRIHSVLPANTNRFRIYSVLKELCKENVLVSSGRGKYRRNQIKLPARLNKQDRYLFPIAYPEEAEEEAKEISGQIPESEIKRREDFRKTLTLTIDPQNAKDFDDALSFRKISDHLYEIGVHISDVTHYIKPGSLIDREAFKRGTSVYLTDKVIPMLPERICNEICSLRPNENKLCFSVVFEIDCQAKIFRKRFLKTVIRSSRRFTYEDVQAIIDKKQSLYKQPDILSEAIFVFHHLAKILREERFKQGSIDFNRKEVQFHMDENGKPLSVSFSESLEAHRLIEEFMLLANKTIAEAIGKISGKEQIKAFVYRVHDVPDREKIEDLFRLIHKLEIPLSHEGKNRDAFKNIRQLLRRVQGTKEQNLVETLALQAMAKAVYTTKNIGHYGLAFDYYTHFTSPIRRYPDMMVHRLLEKYLAGQSSVSRAWAEKCCKHFSEQETAAVQAERTSIKAKQIEFMSDKIGACFEGVISGITEWGIYVELKENGCEGLIPIRYLDDDYYKMDKQAYRLVGKRSGKAYGLCDPLSVQVLRVNREKNQLDFVLSPLKK